MKYFLDTDTCIHYLKGRSPALREKLNRAKISEIAIPTIVKAELLLGCARSSNPEKAHRLVSTFLQPFELAPFDDLAATKYSAIRYLLEKEGKIIGPNDLIIAATVCSQRGTLVTHNTREFKRIKELEVQDWLS